METGDLGGSNPSTLTQPGVWRRAPCEIAQPAERMVVTHRQRRFEPSSRSTCFPGETGKRSRLRPCGLRACGFDSHGKYSWVLLNPLERQADRWRRHPFRKRTSASLVGSTPTLSASGHRPCPGSTMDVHLFRTQAVVGSTPAQGSPRSEGGVTEARRSPKP